MFSLKSTLPKSIKFLGGAVGLTFGGLYLYDARSSIHEYVFCPLIRRITDAEQGHVLGIKLMKYGLVPKLLHDNPESYKDILGVDVFGTTLNTPIGLAAGLDKHGEAIDSLFDCGFSYVEVGSITPEPQPGNESPRFFRLPRDEAVINRYGFNSVGHFNVLANLKLRLAKYGPFGEKGWFSMRQGKLLGINLGKNKFGEEISDYTKGISRMGPYADVLIINVSSPNTPGLRDLQVELKLTELLTTVVKERNELGTNLMGKKPPVLVKIAPDLTEPEIESIANSAKSSAIDGIIVSNTTIQRPPSLLTQDSGLINQTGGLSGKPLKKYSLQALKLLRNHTRDSNLVLIGCGGISSGKDVLDMGKAGATFVQLYTSFAYKGPGLPNKIRQELVEELGREGKTWREIVRDN